MLDSLLVAAVMLGCGGTPMETQLPVNRTRAFSQSIDTLGVAFDIPAGSTRVEEVLPGVLEGFGLEINFREPGRIGTCYQKVRGRLGDVMLSRFVDCGETRSLPNADRYEVALTLLVTVEPDDKWSRIHIFLLGVGLDGSGSSAGRIWCFSKASLERRIAQMVETRALS
ncbi:MAG: hypothetical protein AB7R55_01450 [Gemmatimonadales bacterium]